MPCHRFPTVEGKPPIRMFEEPNGSQADGETHIVAINDEQQRTFHAKSLSSSKRMWCTFHQIAHPHMLSTLVMLRVSRSAGLCGCTRSEQAPRW